MPYIVKLGETHKFKAEPKNEDGSHHDFVHAPGWDFEDTLPVASTLGPLFEAQFAPPAAFIKFRGDAVGTTKLVAASDGVRGVIEISVVAPFASIEVTGELVS